MRKAWIVTSVDGAALRVDNGLALGFLIRTLDRSTKFLCPRSIRKWHSNPALAGSSQQ
jgi:hypothetical protein